MSQFIASDNTLVLICHLSKRSSLFDMSRIDPGVLYQISYKAKLQILPQLPAGTARYKFLWVFQHKMNQATVILLLQTSKKRKTNTKMQQLVKGEEKKP